MNFDGLPLRESEESTAPTLRFHPAIGDAPISAEATVMPDRLRDLSPFLRPPILPRPALGARAEVFQKPIERLIDVVHGMRLVT